MFYIVYTDCFNLGFFLSICDGGLKIFGPRRSPTGTKSDGGGLGLRKKSDYPQVMGLCGMFIITLKTVMKT